MITSMDDSIDKFISLYEHKCRHFGKEKTDKLLVAKYGKPIIYQVCGVYLCMLSNDKNILAPTPFGTATIPIRAYAAWIIKMRLYFEARRVVPHGKAYR